MRRRLTTLQAKQGHNRFGHPRQLIDEMIYREHRAAGAQQKRYGGQFSGWSHASRPRGLAISLRTINPSA